MPQGRKAELVEEMSGMKDVDGCAPPAAVCELTVGVARAGTEGGPLTAEATGSQRQQKPQLYEEHPGQHPTKA